MSLNILMSDPYCKFHLLLHDYLRCASAHKILNDIFRVLWQFAATGCDPTKPQFRALKESPKPTGRTLKVAYISFHYNLWLSVGLHDHRRSEPLSFVQLSTHTIRFPILEMVTRACAQLGVLSYTSFRLS
jgi:hypothetical protein